MYILTAFKSIYDNKTHRQISHKTWESFEKMLYDMSKIPGFKVTKDARFPPRGILASPLISPAVYKENTTRANINVLNWVRWCALDIDSHNFIDIESELKEKIGEYYYVCYSTASSSIEKPKFRLVFPLTDIVESNDIKIFWCAINKLINDVVDTQTKDLSRLYYVPAIYPNANNFIFTNVGSYINPNLLINDYKKTNNSVPDSIIQKLISYRETILKNNGNYNFKWLDYNDCPFINKRMIIDYKNMVSIDGSGRYSMLYKIMSSIAINAIKQKYPISAYEIELLIRQLDSDTINRYSNRPILIEATRAISYAYSLNL